MKKINSQSDGTNIEGMMLSSEFLNAKKNLHDRLALRRKKMHDIIKEDGVSVDEHKGFIEQKVDEIMDELVRIEQEIDVAIPIFSTMELGVKRGIMSDIAQQERDWAILDSKNIRIGQEEVGMWGNFIDSTDGTGFTERAILENLENGEVARISINEFKIFQITKIRTKSKDGYIVCVVEFIMKELINGPGVYGRDNFFIPFPLVKGEKISLIRQNTMDSIASFRINKIEVNSRRKSIIQKFLDLFR